MTTSAEIIYQRRVRLLELAEEVGKVSEACRQIGVSRTRHHEWKKVAEPFGFCHFAAAPGDLVALDSFYIGNLKGVGKVYQLTAVHTCARWAIVKADHRACQHHRERRVHRSRPPNGATPRDLSTLEL